MARSVRVARDWAPFDMKGRDLLGRYKLGRQLSRDSSGTVYQAKDMRNGAVVAVKELAPELVADTRFLQRFRAESGDLTRLDHPNCGKVLDFLEVEGRAYVVSEAIEGRTLREVMSGTSLRPAQALALLRGSLVGLGAAHALGLLHRSLRPESVVVQPDGLVKLTGFDQPAHAAGAAPGDAASAGTSPYAYIAPEQVVGAEADVRTDMYLAGILGFELLAGGPPFTSLDPSELMSMHVSQEPPDLTALRPEVTAPVADIVNRSLAKGPDDRQQSAREFIAQIDAATAALGVEWTEAVLVGGLGAAAMAGGSTLAGGVKPTRGAAPGGARAGRRPRRVLVPGLAALTLAVSTAAYGYSQRWLGVGAGVSSPVTSSTSTVPQSGGSHRRAPSELGPTALGGSQAHRRAPSDRTKKPPGAGPTPPGTVAPPVALAPPAADLLPAQPAPRIRVAVRVRPAEPVSTKPAPAPEPAATEPGSVPAAATKPGPAPAAPNPPGAGESRAKPADHGDQAQHRDDQDGHGQGQNGGGGQD